MNMHTEATTDTPTDASSAAAPDASNMPDTPHMPDTSDTPDTPDAVDAADTAPAPSAPAAAKSGGPTSQTPSAGAAESTQNMSVQARALLADLRHRFPAFAQCLPLAIGIDKLILAETPDLSRKTLRVALNMHTHSSRYLKAMATATGRFDLAGNPAGDVVDEHRARAADMLKERFKKEREQRTAARAAEDAKRRADEAQRRVELEAQARADKLQQLAQKFSGKPGR